MDASEKESFPRTSAASAFALGILTVIVYIAGFAMVAAWFALLVLGQPGPAPASSPSSRTLSSCSVCGVVERVGEFERAGLQLSGDQSEGFAVLLAALGGSLDNRGAAPKYYETAVLHDDGSVRIVRDSSAPQWQRGDRVKVIKGRVEPVVLPAEKTPNPVPPVARAP